MIGITKMKILSICEFPTGWSTIVKQIGKSEATLSVHMNDLINLNLIEYNKEKHYYITSKKASKIVLIYEQIEPLQKQIDVLMKKQMLLINQNAQRSRSQ